MKRFLYIISLVLKSLIILWIPILLIEETFLFDYVGSNGSIILSWILCVLCLVFYIKTYKKANKEINCYLYNIINTIILIILNIALGTLFLNLIDLNIFHQCKYDGWACFLFGIEYLIIGFEYAIFSLIIFVVWLLFRLIKYLISKYKKN